ncbi:MAG: HK97 gp10 family phage protein [Ruminococcus sp.]|nr:HK97 gp10 family phage protein [Ruminococcus sp.]
MITLRSKGNFKKLTGFLERAKNVIGIGLLNKYGVIGCAALAEATPVDTGLTASSWSYEIENKDGTAVIAFHNSNIQNEVPIAIVLQYGHATASGGWVQGRDYINPAIQPVFDKIAEDAWREITR